MIKKQIAFHSTEIEEVYTLYQQAFPKNEQMDLTRLFDELHLGCYLWLLSRKSTCRFCYFMYSKSNSAYFISCCKKRIS